LAWSTFGPGIIAQAIPEGRLRTEVTTAAHPLPRSGTPETAMTDTDFETTQIEAAAFRRLLQHLLQERPDVQNIDLMINAGFCRNCLADWYREAAEHRGITMTKDEAREAIYGMPFAQWKAQHQRDATPEQLAAFEAAQRRHAQ
jgi:uncharacterized protein